ncbi:MAG: DUF2029 domain-containing protein [Candidatus Lokiarchaeota archaeon]|nr:DUF2029 domain-containing protein [Candidatus Lokiarchaeota archaeon]
MVLGDIMPEKMKGTPYFKIKDEFQKFITYIQSSTLMKLGILFNLIWITFTLFAFFYVLAFDNLSNTVFTEDFEVFYTAGMLIRTNIDELYMSSLYNLPYRYLPTFAYFYILVSYIPFNFAYLANVAFMFAINFLSTFMIYELCMRFYLMPKDPKLTRKLIFLFFMAPVQVVNYILGQISPLFIFFLLFSLILIENSEKKVYNIPHCDLYGGILLGLAITLKPFAILVVPFLLVFKGSTKENINSLIRNLDFKRTLNRFFGIIIILIPNLFIFLRDQKLLQEFIDINFHETLQNHHSTSLTRLIIDVLNSFRSEVNQVLIFIVIICITFFISFTRFLMNPDRANRMAYYFQEAMLLMMLSYMDSWFLYSVIWLSVLIPVLMDFEYTYEEAGGRKIKMVTALRRIGRLLNIYFAIPVILYYFVLGFDPLSPVFLLLFYVLYQYMIFKKLSIRKKEVL